MNVFNQVNSNAQSFRTEIAILEEDINKYNPKKAKFSIPALSLSSGTYTNKTSVKLKNKDSGSSTVSVTTSDMIELEIPKPLTRFFTKKVIKKGTKFVVGFIGGDITTIKITSCFDIY